MLTFFEPANASDKSLEIDSISYRNLFLFELSLITCYWIDIMADIFHRSYDNTRNWKEKYIRNKKLSLRFVI